MPSNAVAVVGSQIISIDEFQKAIETRFRGRYGPDERLSRAEKDEVLELLVRRAALYEQAMAAGFDRTPELQEAIRDLVISRFKESRLPTEDVVVTDEEVAAFYASNKARWSEPEARRGAMIILHAPAKATPEKRAEARREAEAVLDAARSSRDEESWAALVLRHSVDHATRYRAGDTGWITRDADGFVDKAIVDALFAIPRRGEFAPLIPIRNGYCVLKWVDERKESVPPLERVADAIRYELSRSKRARRTEEFHARMKANLTILTNEALVESMELPSRVSEPPRLPGMTESSNRPPRSSSGVMAGLP